MVLRQNFKLILYHFLPSFQDQDHMCWASDHEEMTLSCPPWLHRLGVEAHATCWPNELERCRIDRQFSHLLIFSCACSRFIHKVFRCLCHSLPRCPKLIRRNTMDYEIVWECLSFKPAIAADGTSTANFVPYLSNRTPALRLLFRSGQIYGIKVWDFRIDGWFMLFPPFLLPLLDSSTVSPCPLFQAFKHFALCGIYLIAEHAIIINKNNSSLIRQVMTTHDNYYT